MGYQLPIQHFQYQDYFNRLNIPDRDPFEVEKVQPLDLKTKLTEDDLHDDVSQYYNESRFGLEKAKETNSIKRDLVLAELTGKGQNFDTVV